MPERFVHEPGLSGKTSDFKSESVGYEFQASSKPQQPKEEKKVDPPPKEPAQTKLGERPGAVKREEPKKDGGDGKKIYGIDD